MQSWARKENTKCYDIKDEDFGLKQIAHWHDLDHTEGYHKEFVLMSLSSSIANTNNPIISNLIQGLEEYFAKIDIQMYI